MIELKEIKSADPEYAFVEALMHRAFPADERRTAAGQRLVVDTEPRMHCCVIIDAGCPAGLLTWWQLDGVRYVEHFAVDEGLRGRGLGAKAIATLMAASPVPLVLEVEIPDTPLARRRVEFYRRAGLDLWPDTGYVQPPYGAGQSEVPMRLMATAGTDPMLADVVVSQLRRYVYKVPD